jgi:cyclic pyranopterin phosphate synthase
LNRINLSLDTLRRKRFAQIVGVDAYDRVWAGIHAAEEAGFDPLKLNVVALRGINDDEVNDFAQLTLEHAWHIRFIELMPIGDSPAAQDYFNRHFISSGELRARLDGLMPVMSPRGNGPARTYRLPKAEGTLGFIAPASEHFCAECNRVRVTASGEVLSCLFGQRAGEENIVRAETSEAGIAEMLRRAIRSKPEYHACGDAFHITAQTMAEIGG